jgi:transcriptional regulator with XRE-family HTH domain
LTQILRHRRITAMEETLAEVLLAWRKAHGFSQEEASQRCNITRSAWGMLEQGRRARIWDDTFHDLALGTGIEEERLRLAATRSQILKLQGKLQRNPAAPVPA